MNMSLMSLSLIHTSVSPAVWLSTGAPRDMAWSGNVKVYMTARASDETRPVTLSLSYPNGSDRPALHQDFHILARLQSVCMSCSPTGRKVSSLENRYWPPITYNSELPKWTTVFTSCRLPVCNSAAATILSKLPPKICVSPKPHQPLLCWVHHSWQWRRWPWQS